MKQKKKILAEKVVKQTSVTVLFPEERIRDPQASKFQLEPLKKNFVQMKKKARK